LSGDKIMKPLNFFFTKNIFMFSIETVLGYEQFQPSVSS
jgi:hypothetical protein